ncbi:hypothetical protein ACVFYP_07395 [Roseomonas sp. F4]
MSDRRRSRSCRPHANGRSPSPFAHQHDASFPRRPRSTDQQLAAYAGSHGLVQARRMLPGLLRLPRHLREALAAAILADGGPLPRHHPEGVSR